MAQPTKKLEAVAFVLGHDRVPTHKLRHTLMHTNGAYTVTGVSRRRALRHFQKVSVPVKNLRLVEAGPLSATVDSPFITLTATFGSK